MTFGAYSRVNSRIVASIPASACRIVADMPWPSANTIRPESAARSEKWMWQELPSRWFGLAMKVSAMPSCAAISLAAFL